MTSIFSAVDRVRLARAAARYAAHGWDVVPGAAFSGRRFRCDDPGCPTVNCHPAFDFWQDTATQDATLVAGWWRRAPYSVLFPTGRAFDVLELPRWLAAMVSGWYGPVAVTPAGRHMYFVQPGDELSAELSDRYDVLRHGVGSWVPAPPTRDIAGRVRWLVAPGEVGWWLPSSSQVQEQLLPAFAGRAPAAVWSPPRPATHWPLNSQHRSLSGAH